MKIMLNSEKRDIMEQIAWRKVSRFQVALSRIKMKQTLLQLTDNRKKISSLY